MSLLESLANSARQVDHDMFTDRLAHAKNKAAIYEEVRKTSLPVEWDVIQDLDAKMATNQKQIAQMNDLTTLPYPVLSDTPFSWRKDGKPALATFYLDSEPQMKFEADRHGSFSVWPHLPEPINHHYMAYAQELRGKLRSNQRSITHTVHVPVLIPAAVKTNIMGAARYFGSHDLFIVAEAPADAWKEEIVPEPPRPRDPLIIGIRNEIIYLIDRFNMTALESYIASEFSYKQLGPGA